MCQWQIAIDHANSVLEIRVSCDISQHSHVRVSPFNTVRVWSIVVCSVPLGCETLGLLCVCIWPQWLGKVLNCPLSHLIKLLCSCVLVWSWQLCAVTTDWCSHNPPTYIMYLLSPVYASMFRHVHALCPSVYLKVCKHIAIMCSPLNSASQHVLSKCVQYSFRILVTILWSIPWMWCWNGLFSHWGWACHSSTAFISLAARHMCAIVTSTNMNYWMYLCVVLCLTVLVNWMFKLVSHQSQPPYLSSGPTGCWWRP